PARVWRQIKLANYGRETELGVCACPKQCPGRQHRFDPGALKARPIRAQGNALGFRHRFDPGALKARPIVAPSIQSNVAGRAFGANPQLYAWMVGTRMS